MFTERSPREVIEGYLDPLIENVNQKPVYNGGDSTIDPFISVNQPITNPPDNPIAFFTGTDNYLYTRMLARWLNLDYISVKSKDYMSLNTVNDTYFNPWQQKIYVSSSLR